MKPAEARLAQAKYEAEQARKRLAATTGTLQHRLHPSTLASNAWDGVREKSGELAEDAIHAVADRPVKVSGIVAAVALFLAREPILSAIRSWWRSDDEYLVTTRIDTTDENYDITAPAVTASMEGVNA